MLSKCCNHLAEERLSFRLVSLPSNGLDLQRHVSSAVIKRDRSFNVHPSPSFECDQHSRVIPAPFAHCKENQSINNVGNVRTEIALFPETILTQTDPDALDQVTFNFDGREKSALSFLRVKIGHHGERKFGDTHRFATTEDPEDVASKVKLIDSITESV